jgi:hypothetical protein
MNKTIKMKLNYKNISIFLGIVVILLVAFSALHPRSSVQLVPTPYFISTPAQDEYSQAFTNYVLQLEQEGLVTAKEIRVEESKPFIFILKPQNSRDVSDEDVRNVIDLILHTVTVFESRGGLHHDDINIAFHRPAEQKILLVKQHNMPELLSADIYGEMTISLDKSYFMSVVNLAGPSKSGRQDFGNAWSVIQAVCIAYAEDFVDVDAVCNIMSANAAAGWVGMDQEQAGEIINGYGMTQLEYLGSRNYQYRFIDFVYEGFIR